MDIKNSYTHFRWSHTFCKLGCFKHTEPVRGSKRRRQVGGERRRNCYTKNSRQHSSTPLIPTTSERGGERREKTFLLHCSTWSRGGLAGVSILILHYDLND